MASVATVVVASAVPPPFSRASQPTPLHGLARPSGDQRPAGAGAMDWVEAYRSSAPSGAPAPAAAPLAAERVEDRDGALEAVAALPAESAVEAGPEPLLPGQVVRDVRITFYACIGDGFCGTMAGGKEPYEGAAACSYDLPLGTRLRIVNDPTERIYTCEDRGYLTPTWIDVFFWDAADGWPWQRQVGSASDIVVVE